MSCRNGLEDAGSPRVLAPVLVSVVRRICCDLKDIPLADETLKTVKHLGPGTCLCGALFFFFFLMHLLFSSELC